MLGISCVGSLVFRVSSCTNMVITNVFIIFACKMLLPVAAFVCVCVAGGGSLSTTRGYEVQVQVLLPNICNTMT
jgi:hypothetical protein